MKNSKTIINVDLHNPIVYNVIQAQQYDKNSRAIEFHINDGSRPFEITDDIIVRIVGRKANGSFFSRRLNNCEGSIATYVIEEDLLLYAGFIEAKLFITSTESKAISSIPFKINVQKSPCEFDIVEQTERSAMLDLMVEMTMHEQDKELHFTEKDRERFSVLTSEVIYEEEPEQQNGDFWLQQY